jgi:hypothetical protein
MKKHANKVREMAGVCPGGSSAGRAASQNGSRRPVARQPLAYGDVDKACEAWLMANNMDYRARKTAWNKQETGRKDRRAARCLASREGDEA